ncbi:NERD domain-containing protein [Virgibacillus halodenitrificans]|uniref:nuclease-related domain-containing protein n=1 Tax=Virgibacillus halodenitrificans TaxID=1482 RepID=UPI001369F6A1|nr:nuclease-related domain-containing protein [Virgibacillus halodenitrificans]MYL46680.1 NERD domain-containing protein [Virgibacillus halodenitrificans]
MKLNKRNKPKSLVKYEALLQRIRPDHPGLKEIQGIAERELHGFEGERIVDYHTDLLAEEYTILHNICLELQGKMFQIDTLVISKSAIYVIEIKNYKGTVTFNTILKQFTRDDGRKEVGYRYPVTQVELQKFKLERWLHLRDYSSIPIYPLIAISKPSTIIDVNGNVEEIAAKVFHAEYLPKKIVEMDNEHQSRNQLSSDKIGRLMLRESREYEVDILEKHGLNFTDLLTGVRCPYCGRLGMARGHNSWECARCQKKNQTAHMAALADFFLLIETSISNSECQYWLNFKGKHVATRLLRSSGLTFNKKKRRWVLSSNFKKKEMKSRLQETTLKTIRKI